MPVGNAGSKGKTGAMLEFVKGFDADKVKERIALLEQAQDTHEKAAAVARTAATKAKKAQKEAEEAEAKAQVVITRQIGDFNAQREALIVRQSAVEGAEQALADQRQIDREALAKARADIEARTSDINLREAEVRKAESAIRRRTGDLEKREAKVAAAESHLQAIRDMVTKYVGAPDA